MVRTMNVRPYVSLSACVLELQKRDMAIAANRVVAKHRYAKSVSSIRYSMYRVGKVIRLGKCAYMVWLLFMWDLTSQMAVEELIISNEIFARFAFKVSVRVNVYEECKIWTMISISSSIEFYFVFEYIYEFVISLNYVFKKYYLKIIKNICRYLFLFRLLNDQTFVDNFVKIYIINIRKNIF